MQEGEEVEEFCFTTNVMWNRGNRGGGGVVVVVWVGVVVVLLQVSGDAVFYPCYCAF